MLQDARELCTATPPRAWPTVDTARLTLTPLARADVDALVDVMWRERLHLMPSIHVEDDREALRRRVHGFGMGPLVVYVIRRDGEIVGCAGLDPVADADALELSYWLRAGATGRGFAAEALPALCDVGFTRVARLDIWCLADNRASLRVARRLGFRLADRLSSAGRELQLWTAERALVPAWRAIRETCAAVAPVGLDDNGTIHVDGAQVSVGVLGTAPHVLMLSEIGSETVFGERASLEHNGTLAVGALSLVDDRLVLRCAGPRGGFTEETVRLFLHEAHRLRRLTRPERDDGRCCLSSYFTE